MVDTPNLEITPLVEGQTNGEITHNDAMNRLDTVVQLSVKDRDLTAPPGGESNGDRYLVGGSATGAWATHDGEIAGYYDGWIFFIPLEGCRMWIDDENVLLVYDGSSWTEAIYDKGNVHATGTSAPTLTGEVTGVNGSGETIPVEVKTDAKTATDKIALALKGWDSNNTEQIYAKIAAAIVTATGGSEYSDLELSVVVGGAVTTVMTLGADGSVKFGTVTRIDSDGYVLKPTEDAITAANPPAQGSGQLTKEINRVTTVGTANDCVTLPPAAAGRHCKIVNTTVTLMRVYPSSGDAIQGGTVDVYVNLGGGGVLNLHACNGQDWE